MRTKYNDVAKANMAYVKHRKHNRQQTRKIIRRLLSLECKMLGEIRKQMRTHEDRKLL